MKTVLEVLIEAGLPLDRFIASDGFPGMRVRSDEEAALLALKILGVDPKTPADKQGEDGQATTT